MSEKRNWKIRVYDILDCIQAIEGFTESLSCDDFCKNRMVFDAVVRNIEIIGEAVKNIPDEILVRYPEIKWRQVKGIRDVIVHEYGIVSKPVIWSVVRDELPLLKEVVARIDREEKA